MFQTFRICLGTIQSVPKKSFQKIFFTFQVHKVWNISVLFESISDCSEEIYTKKALKNVHETIKILWEQIKMFRRNGNKKVPESVFVQNISDCAEKMF